MSYMVPNESGILVPADTVTAPPKNVSRRGVLSTMGAMGAGVALPASVGGLSLLAAGSAQAATPFNTGVALSSGNTVVSGGNTYTVTIWPHATLPYKLVILARNGVRKAVMRGDTKTYWFNTVGYTGLAGGKARFELSGDAGSINNSLLNSSIDGGRRLADVVWSNPAGSYVYEDGDLSGLSDATNVLWERYTYAGTYFFAAVINGVTSAGNRFWTPVRRFSGANYNTFANKKLAYVNAGNTVKRLVTLERRTMIAASCVGALGVAGAFFSFGGSLAVTASAVATLAGNNLITGQAVLTAIQTQAAAWTDWVTWIESVTADNLVR